MANIGASSRDSSDVNELINFWIKEVESKDTPEENEEDNDLLRESYHYGDSNQTPTNTLRLEKMSSVSISIALWNHATTLFSELEPDTFEYRYGAWFSYKEETKRVDFTSVLVKSIPEWVSHLKLPRLLAKSVIGHFIDIALQVRDWLNYHLNEVFRSDLNRSTRHYCMRRISWYSNGAINYVQTARNLLKSNKLSDENKYRLACAYCLKKEIVTRHNELIGDWVTRLETFYYTFDFSLIDYWNCYYTNPSNLSSTPRFPFQRDSVNEFMIRQWNVKTWSSVKYFFDRLSTENQVNSAIYFIDKGNVEIQHLILGKMNEIQRLSIYYERPVRIIENYARKGGVDLNEPNAISTWYEVRDMISQNQFADLLKRLCKANVSNSVLNEIWISAKIEFKRYILNKYNFDLIGEVFRWGCEKRDLGFDFLFAVLEAGTKFAAKPPTQWTSQRKIFFKKLCEKLVFKKELDLVAGLLDLCVPDANACAKIKRILGEKLFTSANGKKFLMEAAFPRLVRFFKFFFFSKMEPNLVLETCKRLIDEAEFQKLVEFMKIFYPSKIESSVVLEICKRLINKVEFEKVVEFMKIFYPSKIEPGVVLDTCKLLINRGEFVNLEELLNLLYPPNVPESKQEVRDLLLESLECIDLLSYVLYWGENLKELNWPAPLQPSCPEIILQFKTFLLFSKLSIEIYSSQFRLTPGMLNEILSRCLPQDRFIAELVRMIIFSDEGLIKLHKVLCDKNVPHEVVKNQISPFFQSNRYKRKLRAKLMSSLTLKKLLADPKVKEKYLQVLCACGL